MKILITSGGTKIPIDAVRSITNMSNGTFASKIALQLLRNAPPEGHPKALKELVFLRAKHSKSPFIIPVDVSKDEKTFLSNLGRSALLRQEFARFANTYTEVTYNNFDTYAAHLRQYVAVKRFDVVVLAAAVSDYLVKNYVDGKIRSSGDLKIELEPAPKLISEIRKLNPKCKIIGFKLLVDSKKQNLIKAAQESAIKNDCAFVVANDLRDIIAGNHKIMLVDKDGVFYEQEEEGYSDRLADIVAKAIWLPSYDKKAIGGLGMSAALSMARLVGFDWYLSDSPSKKKKDKTPTPSAYEA